MKKKQKKQKSTTEKPVTEKTENTIPREVHEKAQRLAKALMDTPPKPLKDYRVS